jgi:hypothetical protein
MRRRFNYRPRNRAALARRARLDDRRRHSRGAQAVRRRRLAGRGVDRPGAHDKGFAADGATRRDSLVPAPNHTTKSRDFGSFIADEVFVFATLRGMTIHDG